MTISTHWTEAADAVSQASSILVVTHVSPDGDAIGSLMGVTNALTVLGKQVTPAVDNGVPEFLAFIPGADRVLAALNEGEWDLMISVDSSDEERTGLAGAYGRAHSKVVINLDHHATNTLFGHIHLVDSGAVSASEVAYRWLMQMQLPLTPAIAVPLLTGLVTDTIGFRTSNVTDRTLEIAQALMRAGASLTEITARTLDNQSFDGLMLWRRVLQSVRLDQGVIYTVVTQDDLKQLRLTENYDSGLSGFLIKVQEAMVSAVFRELHDGRVELSFRSKPGFDVGRVAFSIGGGGHKQAAGATVTGSLEEVQARVLPLLQAAVEQGSLVIV